MGDHYRNRSDTKRNIGRSRIVGISLSAVSIAAAALLAGCSQPDGSGFGDMEPAAANSEDIDSVGSSGSATSHTNPAEELFSKRKAAGSTSSVPEEIRSGKGKRRDRPLWERPEVLAKYPVKAKRIPMDPMTTQIRGLRTPIFVRMLRRDIGKGWGTGE